MPKHHLKRHTRRKQFIPHLIMVAIVFLLALGVYLVADWQWSPHQRPTGDEPHYLIIAQSIFKDHDLDLTNNYADKDYQAWNYPNVILENHISPNSQHGKQYSVHSIGWPILLAYPLKWGGVAGARAVAALAGALLALNIFLFTKKVTGEAEIAWAIFIATAFSIPFITYSAQLFSEIFAALLICYAARKIYERLPDLPSQVFSILAIAYLPWIHVKYIWVSIFLFLIWLFANRKSKSIFFGLIFLASGVLLSYLFHQWYGSYLPNAQYPASFGINFHQLLPGTIGLLIDAHHGLLVYSPIYIFSLAGFIHLLRKDRWLALILFGGFLSVFVLNASAVINIGFSPVGRWWVAVLPLAVLPLGILYPMFRTWNKIIFWTTAAWGTLAGYLLIIHPDLNYSTGEPKFLEQMSSKLIDLTHYFPKIIAMDNPAVISNWHPVYWWGGAIAVITAATLIFKARPDTNQTDRPRKPSHNAR